MICHRDLKLIGSIVTDSSIVAMHHGEPSTVRQFFRKEMWRGKSNFSGMIEAKLTWSEIPSLLAPLFIILLFALVSSWLSQSRHGRTNYVLIDFSFSTHVADASSVDCVDKKVTSPAYQLSLCCSFISCSTSICSPVEQGFFQDGLRRREPSNVRHSRLH